METGPGRRENVQGLTEMVAEEVSSQRRKEKPSSDLAPLRLCEGKFLKVLVDEDSDVAAHVGLA